MASEPQTAPSIVDIDSNHVQDAKIIEQDQLPTSPIDGRATEKDTVELVLTLSRDEAERLAQRFKSVDAAAASNLSAPSPSHETASATPDRPGPATRLRTSSRTKASDAPKQESSPRVTRATTNGSTPNSAPTHQQGPPAPPSPSSQPSQSSPSLLEMQQFFDTERSYTNAFHKTLSLFVDDKTFSTPSLRNHVVGFLESSNATVLETLPQHNHALPEHLRQEIENHVNLVKTVLQRGGVFAEEEFRARLKKLAAHLPRIEAAIGRYKQGSKAPVLMPRSDEDKPRELSPATIAANEVALHQAAEAAARANDRHQHSMMSFTRAGPPDPDPALLLVNGYGPSAPPPPLGIPPVPIMQVQQLPPMRNKTFVPPSLVPSQTATGARPDDSAPSPPPVLAPFDPRPNPMACLFCRQRKIRCIGHKPHPCEICVKRGFVCSYDWISRRGKRKPKNPDGTPIDAPQQAVNIAPAPQQGESGQSIPIVNQPPLASTSSQPLNAPPPPAVGMHPNPALHAGMQIPGMPPGVPPPQPGPDGAVPPGFAFTFLPGHPGFPGPPPHLAPALPPQPSKSPSFEKEGTEGMDDSTMAIDPSLMSDAATVGVAKAASAEVNGEPVRHTCYFCREQHLKCEGNPPDPCMHCVRRGNTCKYIPLHERDKEARQAARRKKRGSDLDGTQGKKAKTSHPPPTAEPQRSASADEDTDMANADGDAEDDEIGGEAAHVDASL